MRARGRSGTHQRVRRRCLHQADRRQPSSRPRQCLHRHRGLQRAHGGRGPVLRPRARRTGRAPPAAHLNRAVRPDDRSLGTGLFAHWSLRALCAVGAGRRRPESHGLLESARRVLRPAPGAGHGTRARRRWPGDRADACPLGAADRRRRLAHHLRVPRRRDYRAGIPSGAVLAAGTGATQLRRPRGSAGLGVRRGDPQSPYWTLALAFFSRQWPSMVRSCTSCRC